MKKVFSFLIVLVAIVLIITRFTKNDKEEVPEDAPSFDAVQDSDDTDEYLPDEDSFFSEPEYTEPEYKQVYNLKELSDYLNSEIENDNLDISFEYLGDTADLIPRTIAQMVSKLYITIYDESETVRRVVVTEYPGDDIVDAYYTGDLSKLDSDEILALEKAVTIVEEAKLNSSNTIEIERYLHDWLCDNITYDDYTREVTDENNPPRNLTAVGALLDGRANCQGYSDGFYTLASIAGFEVGRISVASPDDYHMTNTICLDGSWYIVDATYDDSEINGESVTTYKLFNAGEDMCCEYSWGDEMEYNPISEVSDSNYYYYLPDSGYSQVFWDVESMADSVAYYWYNYGYSSQNLMLAGSSVTWDDLSHSLSSELDNMGVYYSYYIYSFSNGRDTFFRVVFD